MNAMSSRVSYITIAVISFIVLCFIKLSGVETRLEYLCRTYAPTDNACGKW
jgi:hypothetical protein